MHRGPLPTVSQKYGKETNVESAADARAEALKSRQRVLLNQARAKKNENKQLNKEYVKPQAAKNNTQNYDPLPLSAFSEQEKTLFFPIIDKLAFKQIQPHEVFGLLNNDDAVLERFKVFVPSVRAAREKYHELLEKEQQSEERLRGFRAEHERLQQNITYNYQVIAQAQNTASTSLAKHLREVSTSTSSSKARVF